MKNLSKEEQATMPSSPSHRFTAVALPDATRIGQVACLGLLLSQLLTFENLADLKLFLGGSIPLAGVPFQVYNEFFGPADEYLILPCDQLSNVTLLRNTLNPLLFKKCIPNPQNLTLKNDFVTFPDSFNNMFASCGDTKVVRHFKYTTMEGETKEIEEKIPCTSSTLEEKFEFYERHDPVRDGPYFDVNVFGLSNDKETELEQDFKEKGFIPDDLHFASFTTFTVLVHFFASGTTAVDYFHSHFDRFFSFGIQTTKVWELINPKYHDAFEYEYSGNAVVLTKEKRRVPRVTIHQEPGDVLFVSPWWIHKTRFDESVNTLETRNLNFNIHVQTSRSLVGLGAQVFMRWLGNPSWWYDNGKNEKTLVDHGLSFNAMPNQ